MENMLRKQNAFHQKLLILFIPLSILVLDIFIRFKSMADFSSEQFGFYALSIAVAASGWILFAEFLRRIWRFSKRIAVAVILLISFVEIFIIVSSYGFYRYFTIIPNYYSIEYLVQETENSIIIFTSSIYWWHIVLFIAGIAGMGYFLNRFVQKNSENKFSNFATSGSFFVLTAGLLVLNNNIRFQDQCFLPDVNFGVTTARLVQNHIWFKKDIGYSGLRSAFRVKLPKYEKKIPANVLIILNESLRRQNLSFYGYQKETTPFLSKFLSDHKNEIFLFRRAYANATTTMLSVTSIFTGVSPVQPGIILHKMPLVFDFAKALNYQTFFISAHSFNWRNFQLFFTTPTLDFFWNKEIGKAPQVNDLGTDDKYVLEQFRDYLPKLRGNFLGVIHTNTTHYPYYSNQPQTENLLENYDNSILHLDGVMQELFDMLKQRNLLENTIIIFTSDHGEAFGEHRYFGHVRTYYEEESAIPFWIYIPKQLHQFYFQELKNLFVNQDKNISNLDMTPTILDLLKINNFPENLDKNYIGKSLLREIDTSRFILMLNSNEVSNYKMFVSIGTLQKNFKYIMIKKPSGFTEALYNLDSDPQEQKNVASAYPAKMDSIYSELSRYEATAIIMEEGRDLGYAKRMNQRVQAHQ